MFLQDYLSDLTEAIKDATQTGMILSSQITTDFRSDKIGFITGQIFTDGSTLFFKEYVDLRYRIDKKTYSFHYQDQQARIRFRYDNALHKPDLGFADHKHIGNKIVLADIPDLAGILGEIMTEYFPELSEE
jgi:hypothetical protein